MPPSQSENFWYFLIWVWLQQWSQLMQQLITFWKFLYNRVKIHCALDSLTPSTTTVTQGASQTLTSSMGLVTKLINYSFNWSWLSSITCRVTSLRLDSSFQYLLQWSKYLIYFYICILKKETQKSLWRSFERFRDFKKIVEVLWLVWKNNIVIYSLEAIIAVLRPDIRYAISENACGIIL